MTSSGGVPSHTEAPSCAPLGRESVRPRSLHEGAEAVSRRSSEGDVRAESGREEERRQEAAVDTADVEEGSSSSGSGSSSAVAVGSSSSGSGNGSAVAVGGLALP